MLRIGFFQFHPHFGKVERNRNYVVEKLKNVNVNLIVLPELTFTGYHFRDKSELLPLAESLSDSPTLKALCELSSMKDMCVVTGFAEREQNNIYNSALLVGPKGLIHTYRKIQLFNREKEIFEPGNIPLQVNEIKGVKVGMMVCFDWIFPEVTRVLVLKGADIICHPANLVLSYCQSAMLTRCLENNVFAVTANRFGADNRPHGTLKFTGKSQIAAPKGKLIYRARSQREELYVVEIDPIQARDKKMTEKNDIITDRRPAMYRTICE